MTNPTPITGDASSKSYYVIHPVYATAQGGPSAPYAGPERVMLRGAFKSVKIKYCI